MHSFTNLPLASTASLASHFIPLCPCLREENPSLFSRCRRARMGRCKAELSLDAPFAAAIGGCVLNSFAFPVAPPVEEGETESLFDSTDARFAVMGIIGFIPYFNWLSWVFAWLDTGKVRYAVYALAYLAPYLRSNLSLSPNDSWLPIASIIWCLAHIQLEASIKNGDVQGFQFFSESTKYFSSFKLLNRTTKKDTDKENKR